MLEQKRQILKQKVKTFPTQSGCYLMLNEQKEILYVGKAKSLQKRILSYFKVDHESLKVRSLVHHIDDIEFILTSNEVESLVLENNLIKMHHPKYNIRLRDDKSYPYLQWNTQEAYPRLEYTRRPKRQKYFAHLGPFPEGFSIKMTLNHLIKLFELRDCSTREFSKRKMPCLLHQMNQCMAPCVRLCTPEQYLQPFQLLVEFLKNPKESAPLITTVKSKIEFYSSNEEFEKALRWRNVLHELSHYVLHAEEQKVEYLGAEDNIDFIGYFAAEHECDISIYMVRQGRLIGMHHFYWLSIDNENTEEEVASKLLSYYQHSNDISDKIITPWNKSQIQDFLTALKRINVSYKNVQVLTRNNLFAPLLTQAKNHAMEKCRIRKEEQKQTLPMLQELQSFLKMEFLPRVIECFDIAIWQGSSPTASQVVFVEGRPAKAEYRYYHLEKREELNNDFAMMKEVLERRVKKGQAPDLIVIDGGRAQLNVALKVFKEAQFFVPVVALAKEKMNKKERIFFPEIEEAREIDTSRSYAKLLMHIRDEAHRFSRKLHHHEEKKRLLGFSG
jgi:excinuclease ABC subunit C